MIKNKQETNEETIYDKLMPAGQYISNENPAQPSNSRDIKLVNVMEDLVLSRLDSTLERFNCCKCSKCKKDIAAIALNRLAPRYTIMKENNTEKRKTAEDEYGANVISAIIQAILIVKESPRH